MNMKIQILNKSYHFYIEIYLDKLLFIIKNNLLIINALFGK